MKHSLKADQTNSSIFKVLQNKLTITCDLCNHQIIDPRMCPSCNQIYCYQCLWKYHQSYKNCPLCHEKITMQQFIQCDCGFFLNVLRKQLKQVKMVTKEGENSFGGFEMASGSNSPQEQRCKEHNLKFSYYCQTCTRPICSDCGMMSSEHKNHRFTRLNDIYTKIKEKLHKELSRLTNKILNTQQHSLRIKKRLQMLQIQHSHIKRYTQEYYILLVQKFEEQIATKTVFLKQIQEKNGKDIQFYELCRDSICEQIERKSRNQLINETDKILSSFTIKACQPPEPLKIQESFETIKELLPEYNNFEYCLNNFALCGSGIVYSDTFLLNGVEWRLKIYPKGNGVAKGKYLSVFVQMTKAEKNQKKYEYKIQLLSKDITFQNIRREYCSAFDIGQCWGYNQFILLEQLSNGFLNDDKLYFVMGIRNPDYRLLSQDQSNYIEKLQQEVRIKQLQKQNYIEQTNIIDQLQMKPCPVNKNAGSINNDTQFLKFLDNSNFSHQQRMEERQRRQKQREKQTEKSERDQQFQVCQFINDDEKLRSFTDPNKQKQSKKIKLQSKPPLQQNNFVIKKQETNDQVSLRQNLGSIKPSTKIYEEQTVKKSKIDLKQISSKNKKYQKSSPVQNIQGKIQMKSEQLQQKGERMKQKQKISQRYQFYLSSSNKLQSEQKKEYKKSKTYQDSNFEEEAIYPEEKQVKESKKYLQSKKSKLQQSKEANSQFKHDQHKLLNKHKKYTRTSPYKMKQDIQQSDNKKKQISNILEQSKKLQGIMKSDSKGNHPQIKETNHQLFLRSPTKTSSQIKTDKQKEELKTAPKQPKQFQS